MNENKQAIACIQNNSHFHQNIIYKALSFFYQIMSALLLSGDIESNPGPFHGMYCFTNLKSPT